VDLQGRDRLCSNTGPRVGTLQRLFGVLDIPGNNGGAGNGLLHTLLDLCHRLCHACFPACEPLALHQMKNIDYWKDTNMTAVSTSWATSEHTNGAQSYLRHPLSHIAKRKSPEPATGKVGRPYVRVQSAMLCQALILLFTCSSWGCPYGCSRMTSNLGSMQCASLRPQQQRQPGAPASGSLSS